MFKTGLDKGEAISNLRLMDIFHCACEGGIRYSSRTGTVVLVINNTKEGLPSWVRGDEALFAGRPLKNGVTGANKRLKEFLEEGKPVFLFEVKKPGAYEYVGPVALNGEMRIERNGEGLEWPVFPLRVEEGGEVQGAA